MYAIKITNLTKEFDSLIAVDNISLTVEKGELFGLLGPNGAGKTTTIKMLATLLKPTKGDALVWGYNILRDRDNVRRSIGIVFQESALDRNLTGRENLDFHARMYGISSALIKERIGEVLGLVELSDKANILVQHYSGGMQRRLEIARGLMHHPNVLFLDEPTLGLDTQTRRHIWDYIKKLNEEEEVTMVLTTHYMEEADYLCNRVAIMDHGRIVALDTPINLKNAIGADVVSLQVSNSNEFVPVLKKVDWIRKIVEHNGVIDLSVENGDKRIPELIGIAQSENIVVESVNLRKPTLEDVYLHFTGKTIREEEASQKDMMRARMGRR